MICAERLGLTGTGGGGIGESSVRRVRWRLFRLASSSCRARELEEDVMALEVGSRCIGRRAKLSGSSIFEISVHQYSGNSVSEVCFAVDGRLSYVVGL